MSGRNQNLKYFFLNLEKEWKMLSWLTQTISSKNILSQRRKAIYPAPKSPSPPWPVLKSSQEGWAATNKKNSDVWECAELSAAAQCSHLSSPPPPLSVQWLFTRPAQLSDKWAEHVPSLLEEISDCSEYFPTVHQAYYMFHIILKL